MGLVKMMHYKILDGQGRIVLPQELREMTDIHKGDILELSVRKNVIEIKKLDIVKLNDDSNESKRNTVIAAAKELDKASLLMLAKKLVEFAEKEEEFDGKNTRK